MVEASMMVHVGMIDGAAVVVVLVVVAVVLVVVMVLVVVLLVVVVRSWCGRRLSGRGSPVVATAAAAADADHSAALDGRRLGRDGRQRLGRFGGRGVRVLVLGQVGLLPETLAAHVAHERFLAGVRAYVHVHRVLVLEALAAYVTVVQRPFLLGRRRTAGRLVVARRHRRDTAAARRPGRRTAAAAAGTGLFRFAVGVVRPPVVLLGRPDGRRRRRRGHLHRFPVVQHDRGRDLRDVRHLRHARHDGEHGRKKNIALVAVENSTGKCVGVFFL